MTDEAIVRNVDSVQLVTVEHSKGASIQVILGPKDELPHFYLRRFTIEPGGTIPAHSHPDIEHEQYVLEGEMVLTMDDEAHVVMAGDSIYIPAGVVHGYENRGQVPVRFLCMVPRTERYRTDWKEETPGC